VPSHLQQDTTPTATTKPSVVVSTASVQQEVADFIQGSIDMHNYTIKDINTGEAANKLIAIDYAFTRISSDLKCQSADPGNDYQKRLADTISGQADNRDDANTLAGKFNQLRELKAKYKSLNRHISVAKRIAEKISRNSLHAC